MATSVTQQARTEHAWSLGAVLAEREVDERTWLLVVRAEAGLGAALGLGRRLIALRLAGYTTIVVNLADSDHISDPVLAMLLEWRRRLALRNGRLVVTAERLRARRALEQVGLEVAEL